MKNLIQQAAEAKKQITDKKRAMRTQIDLLEKQEWDFWSIGWWSNEQVTHWMPLPSIPAFS